MSAAFFVTKPEATAKADQPTGQIYKAPLSSTKTFSFLQLAPGLIYLQKFASSHFVGQSSPDKPPEVG